MKEESQVLLSFTINKEVLIKETLREAWAKVKLISELNHGLINKIKIISK